MNKEMPRALAHRSAAASLVSSFGNLGSNCLLVFVDPELNLIKVERMPLNGRELSWRGIKGHVRTALQRGAGGIFLISEAERGGALSPSSLTFVDRLRAQLAETRCDFIDHLIVNGQDVVGLYGPSRAPSTPSPRDSNV